MFRNLLDWAFKQADVTPVYQAHHCLSVRGDDCRKCADICPHEAITIRRTVQIESVDCTGCGLCVSACPSQALTPRHEAPRERNLRCSQVAGESSSVTCLARLQASTLAQMGASGHAVTLARGDCNGCKVGGADVPAALAANITQARALLAMHGQALEISVVETDAFEVPRDDRTISRRELFQGGWQNIKRGGDVLLAPLEKLGSPEDDPRTDRSALPREHQLRLRAIELAQPAPDARVPLRLPAVADGCILCPACTRVCPTNAIKRVYDGSASGGSRLDLEPERCIGCDACVDACPVDVVSMRDDVVWGEVTGPTQTIYRATPSFVALESVARPAPTGSAADAAANAAADNTGSLPDA